MKRIYHTWEKWECFPAGFYGTTPPKGITGQRAEEMYAEFLRDLPRFERALGRVISEWPRSCEHYLSNETMNRVAWLGQASMCIESRIPHGYRSGFSLLRKAEAQAANELALRYLNIWLEQRGEPSVNMTGAGVSSKVNLY